MFGPKDVPMVFDVELEGGDSLLVVAPSTRAVMLGLKGQARVVTLRGRLDDYAAKHPVSSVTFEGGYTAQVFAGV